MAPDKVVWLVRLVFAVLALGAVALFVVRPVWRMLRAKPELALNVPDYAKLIEGAELEIPEAEQAGLPDRHDLIEQARADPRATALLVQRWLKEKR